MEALLGFSLDFWDYVTFLSLFVITAAILGVAVFFLGLPGRIAIARNHPEADARLDPPFSWQVANVDDRGRPESPAHSLNPRDDRKKADPAHQINREQQNGMIKRIKMRGVQHVNRVRLARTAAGSLRAECCHAPPAARAAPEA